MAAHPANPSSITETPSPEALPRLTSRADFEAFQRQCQERWAADELRKAGDSVEAAREDSIARAVSANIVKR